MSASVALVLKGYPRLSETFIAQEILAIERSGVPLEIISLRHPTDPAVHPVHEEIRAPVRYLPEYLHQEPGRVLRAWRALSGTEGYRRCRRVWLRDLRRDPTANRVRRFGQALVLAHELSDEVVHLHAHFLHTPASVTRYAAMLSGREWTFSAHAKDIWTSPSWDKREKLADCAWGVTCTSANLQHLRALAPRPERVSLVYHGIDLARFERNRAVPSGRDGTDRSDPLRILSVGRAVPKKGYDVLLEALARLPRGFAWRFDHVGGGGLRGELERQARTLGIDDRVIWHGPLEQRAVLGRYREADLFALACRVAADGDRDGLPNVLVEAQSQGLACVSTRVSAVPELIRDGETGLLTEPEDPGALAAAIERIGREPSLRRRLAEAGAARVREHFSLDASVAPLLERFGDLVRPRLAAGG